MPTLFLRPSGYADQPLDNVRITRTVHANDLQRLAGNADDLALGRCAGRWSFYGLPGGTYVFPFRKHPSSRFARLDIFYRDLPGVFQLQSLDLSVRDGTHTVLSSSALIPTGLKGERGFQGSFGTRATMPQLVGVILDIQALAAVLTASPDWFFMLVAGFDSPTATMDRLEFYELPRAYMDTTLAAGGAPVTSLQQGLPIAAGDATGTFVDGVQRILGTLDFARIHADHYLCLQWPDVTTYPAIPQTTASGVGLDVFTNLEDGAGSGVPRSWKVYVRRLSAASAVGEPIRWRIRYATVGGAGTETAKVRLQTGSASAPFDALLAYSAAFTWSAWQTAAFLATTGTGQLDTLTFLGKVSAVGPTLYVSGIEVIGDPS